MDKNNYDVVCFGEILWDVLGDKELPGGAPVNVAYHLARLDKKVAIISRIGNDKRGQDLKKNFEDGGIDTQYLQTDMKYPTGTVLATRDKSGDMKYDIIEHVAWDYITLEPEFQTVVSNSEYFVFGSLAARNEVSKKTLFTLLEMPVKKVMDINLRPPFYEKALILHELSHTDILKMNEEELKLVVEWYGDYKTIEDRMKFLQDRFEIKTVIGTLGANGALVLDDGKFYRHPGYRVVVADTIGSGDSFLAGFLSKYIETGDTENSLRFASALGSYIATQNGGSPEYSMGDIVSFMYTTRVKESS